MLKCPKCAENIAVRLHYEKVLNEAIDKISRGLTADGVDLLKSLKPLPHPPASITKAK